MDFFRLFGGMEVKSRMHNFENSPWTLCLLIVKIGTLCKEHVMFHPYIYLSRECHGGFEIAVNSTYLSMAPKHTDTYELNVEYNPINEFTKEWDRRSFLIAGRSAVIPSVKLCYRNFAMSLDLCAELELQILHHEFNGGYYPEIRRKIAQALLFIGLNLIQDLASPAAIKLIQTSQSDLLGNMLGHFSQSLIATKCNKWQVLTLLRRLARSVGGNVEDYQERSLQSSPYINGLIYGSFVGVSGEKLFGSFNGAQMYNSLAQCQVFNKTELHKLNIREWVRQIAKDLYIGETWKFLPVQLLDKLDLDQAYIVNKSIIKFRQQYKNLLPVSNSIILLTYTSLMSNAIAQEIFNWANVPSAVELLLQEHRYSTSVLDIGLTLVALFKLIYFDHHPVILSSFDGQASVVDFNKLLIGEQIQNVQVVVERMACHFLVAIQMSSTSARTSELTHLFLDNFVMPSPEYAPLNQHELNYWIQRVQGKAHNEVWEAMYSIGF